jgi:23S rRNA pseudouridine1911/1915/1917 synthase
VSTPPATSLRHGACATYVAGPDDAGSRLDVWLARQIPDVSRARLQHLLRDGFVCVGLETVREPNRRVKPGEVYAVTLPEAAPSAVAGEAIALNVVYEDRDVIVIDKPAGLVVHPAAGHATGTLVNALIAHCGESLSGIGGVRRPGIVHRLDKDTSGLLVVAKNDAAHQSLSDQFKSHGLDGRLSRRYLALVWGVLPRPKDRIDAALARSITNRTRISVSKSVIARHAVTHYEVVKVFPGAKPAAAVSLLQLELETGRTHQIRVHLAHIGHPVLGDPVYGAGFKTRIAVLKDDVRLAVEHLRRQALHAAALGFEHPRTAAALAFESPLPADIAHILELLEGPARNRPEPNRAATKPTDRRRPKR